MKQASSDIASLADTLRSRIRARMAEQYLTHAEVARRLSHRGVTYSQRSVSRVISGEVRPKLDELHVWAAVLGTTSMYLLGFTYDPTAPVHSDDRTTLEYLGRLQSSAA